MKRRLFVFILAIFVAALPELVAAQGRGGASKPVKPSRPVTQVKTQKPAHTTTSASRKPSTSPRKTTTPGAVKKTTTAGTSAKSGKTTPTTTTTTTNTPTSGETTPPPALPKNPKLVERLQNLLPKGTDINKAAADFRNQGQFVAAVHVSNNLGIKFEDLKSRMVDDGMSLGQAVKKLRPEVDANQAVTTATAQANNDLGTTTAKNKRKPQ